MPDDNLTARRERAKTAYHDALSSPAIDLDGDPVDAFAEALDAAIESATRVEITNKVVEAYYLAFYGKRPSVRYGSDVKRRAGLKAAFAAAGFEVTDAAS